MSTMAESTWKRCEQVTLQHLCVFRLLCICRINGLLKRNLVIHQPLLLVCHSGILKVIMPKLNVKLEYLKKNIKSVIWLKLVPHIKNILMGPKKSTWTWEILCDLIWFTVHIWVLTHQLKITGLYVTV